MRRILSDYERDFDRIMNEVESIFQFKTKIGRHEIQITSETSITLLFADINYTSKDITIYPDLWNRLNKSMINEYGEMEVRKLIAKKFGVPNFRVYRSIN